MSKSLTQAQKNSRIIQSFLVTHPGEWSVSELFRQIGNFDDLLPHHIRRAAKLLPKGCVTKQGRKLVFSARFFAPKEEVVSALQSLPNWDFDLPVMIEKHIEDLRASLVLADANAFQQSLRWASHGKFEIGFSYYGQYVREVRRS